MRRINIDEGWIFDKGIKDFFPRESTPTQVRVNLPHDYMISSDVNPDVPAGTASGFYTAGVAHYIKKLNIPKEWENDIVTLEFDGVMMNATLEVNRNKVALQHYGYAPFSADITPWLYFGQENQVVVTVNPSMQPNSRWYTGAGIFRSVHLVHRPAVCIAHDGIYAVTRTISRDLAGLAETATIDTKTLLENHTDKNLIAELTLDLLTQNSKSAPVLSRTIRIQIPPRSGERAELTLTVDKPVLWDAEDPNLYSIRATVTPYAEFRTHLSPFDETNEAPCRPDTETVLFGIRTITTDVRNGLRINGRTVKLKGGCVHHDNGILGAVTLRDAEERRVRKLKALGYNAIRTTHNPPSTALLNACDKLGLYVFDEAFDAWSMGKQPGDYNQYFDTDWEKDLTAFVTRDRTHPSVILWSTGNEITERGGLGNGYTLATRIARKVKELDPSRPVTNAVCSFWSGLDEGMMKEFYRRVNEHATGAVQNASAGEKDLLWEEYTWAYTNGLDLVGYNYMEEKYEQDHILFPERVMLGSENFPNQIGIHWPLIEKLPYVLGEFTWTAVDYIGEAGIGKSIFMNPDDMKPGEDYGFDFFVKASVYPWRTANDADLDICGNVLPQGTYRSIVWNNALARKEGRAPTDLALFSYDPAVYGYKELISSWGFTGVRSNWTWKGQEGRPVRVAAFSAADKVALFLNGRQVAECGKDQSLIEGMPLTFAFDITYEPGTLEAVAYVGGQEVARSSLTTTGSAVGLRLIAEESSPSEFVSAPAEQEEISEGDVHSLRYVRVELVDDQGNLVQDSDLKLKASATGAMTLAGFGSGNPVTDENYTAGSFTTYRGRALAILRAAGATGETELTVSDESGRLKASLQVTL